MELKIILKSKLGINIFCYENISLYFIYYIHIIYVYIYVYIFLYLSVFVISWTNI